MAAGSWLLLSILLLGLLYMHSRANTRDSPATSVVVPCIVSLAAMDSCSSACASVDSGSDAHAAVGFCYGCSSPDSQGGPFCLRDIAHLRSTQYKRQIRVAIYGAGEAGAQLAASLRLAGNYGSSPSR